MSVKQWASLQMAQLSQKEKEWQYLAAATSGTKVVFLCNKAHLLTVKSILKLQFRFAYNGKWYYYRENSCLC